MSMVKAGDIANMIRKECGISITNDNDGKTVFDKEELLLIIAGITSKRQASDEAFITNVIEKVLETKERIATRGV